MVAGANTPSRRVRSVSSSCKPAAPKTVFETRKKVQPQVDRKASMIAAASQECLCLRNCTFLVGDVVEGGREIVE